MHAKVIWAVLALLIVGGLAWFAFGNRAMAPTEETLEQTATSTTQAPANEEDGGPAFTVITLTDTGFSPASVTIAAGETVRFVNDSSRGMWVGSDDHPTHTKYDGTSTREHCADGVSTNGTFDQCQSVNRGDYWDYTFERAGTFGYHNHVGASNTGTVIVR